MGLEARIERLEAALDDLESSEGAGNQTRAQRLQAMAAIFDRVSERLQGEGNDGPAATAGRIADKLRALATRCDRGEDGLASELRPLAEAMASASGMILQTGGEDGAI